MDRSTPLFRDDADRRTFLLLLWRAASRHEWSCHAICLMSTHYHLVVEAKRVQASAGLCWLHGRYARQFNRRHGRFGHVFANRFTARAIGDEQYVHDACAYVLLNPVRAGLCNRIEDWPWSYSRLGLEAA